MPDAAARVIRWEGSPRLAEVLRRVPRRARMAKVGLVGLVPFSIAACDLPAAAAVVAAGEPEVEIGLAARHLMARRPCAFRSVVIAKASLELVRSFVAATAPEGRLVIVGPRKRLRAFLGHPGATVVADDGEVLCG